MNVDLTGKRALVTGGGRGLGREISLALAEAGAEVILTWCNDLDAATKTVGKIMVIGKEEASCLWLDLTDEGSINEVVSQVEASWDFIDVLVNNAGVNKPMGFLDTGRDDLKELLEVNLVGPFVLTGMLLPLISNGGSIVWIGSSSADTGGPKSVHYSLSKAGLLGLSRGVAVAGAERDVRSNVVQPGYLASPMADEGMADPQVAKIVAGIPLQRLGTFREVANAVAFLASDAASYVTGQVLRVDGGLTFGS